MKRNKEELVMTLPIFTSEKNQLKETLYFCEISGMSVDELISKTFDYNG
jgi:hypothetical protein